MDVKDRLFKAAKAEFSEKGFKEASLRNISKAASVTTGAFYVYFKSKEDLFMQTVSPAVEGLLDYYRSYGDTYFTLSFEEQKRMMFEPNNNLIDVMINYVYDRIELFQIALTKSAGTKYENLIDLFVDVEELTTSRMIQVFSDNGVKVNKISKESIHILISANFTAFFEPIKHGFDRQTAKEHIAELRRFFNAGWRELLFGD